jgi:hypothetical protein
MYLHNCSIVPGRLITKMNTYIPYLRTCTGVIPYLGTWKTHKVSLNCNVYIMLIYTIPMSNSVAFCNIFGGFICKLIRQSHDNYYTFNTMIKIVYWKTHNWTYMPVSRSPNSCKINHRSVFKYNFATCLSGDPLSNIAK